MPPRTCLDAQGGALPDIHDAARKRSTHDLIDELDAEAEHALLAAIVVGFTTKASFVFATDMNRLAALNRLIRKAGRPIGIVTLYKNGNGIQFFCRPFQEYGGACLLGVKGNVVKAHGRSRSHAIKNAINLARQTTESDIFAAIKKGGEKWATP